jgi:peptidoglycan/LPS O-acetylase OafA/YrhL
MRNKFIKDFVVVIFALLLASSLIARLVGMIVYSVLPSNDLGIAVVAWALAFGLSYFGAWYFFNQWKAKFWIKVCIAIGVIVLCRAAFNLVDMNAVFNMSHR